MYTPFPPTCKNRASTYRLPTAKSCTFPCNYLRTILKIKNRSIPKDTPMVRVARLELTTPWPPVKCATNCATPGFQFAALEVSLVIIACSNINCNTFFHFFQNFLLRQISESLLTNPIWICYHTISVQEDNLPLWRDVRVVEGTGLENRRRASVRGFESHSLRHAFTIAYESAEVPKRPKGLPC